MRDKEIYLPIFRKKIDQIDKKILSLLIERFGVVADIHEIKKENNIPLLDEKRFGELLLALKEKGKKAGVDEKIIEDIWHRIHLEGLSRQK